MVNTFIKREEKEQAGFPIGAILGLHTTKGEIGIEIEVEGTKLPKGQDDLAPFWMYHKDGSLRGKDNAEYVLRKPILFDEVPLALDVLWGKFTAFKSTLDDSNRTSVHVHLNCQQFHMNRLTSFVALYTCFEEILTEWCGDHRVGNLFCLRTKDAPGIISRMKKFVMLDGRYELSDGLHYAGLNASALQKFGSLEIRTLRGVSDPSIILNWVSILQRLYELSKNYKDPRDICATFSGYGPSGFFDYILGPVAGIVRQNIPFNESRIHESMFEGIRYAQDLCYCRDWDLFKEITVKPDPFGRSLRKVTQSMAAQEGGPAAASPTLSASGPTFSQVYQTLQSWTPPTPTVPTASLTWDNANTSEFFNQAAEHITGVENEELDNF